jgi:hypothetical protein
VNVHPALTWRKDFTQKVQQSITSVYSTLALGSAPSLQIRPNTIAYGKRGEKRELTSVLEIQCDKVNSQHLKDALMSEDFLLAPHLDLIPTGNAQATSPQDNINVMQRHEVFLQNTRSVPIMGLPKELANSRAIGGGTNLQLLLQMTNSTSPVVLSIEPTGTPGKYLFLCVAADLNAPATPLTNL